MTSPGTVESVSWQIVFDSILMQSIFLFNVKHYAYSLFLFMLKKTKEIIATAVDYQVGACGEDGDTFSSDLCIRSIRENRKVIITCKGKTKNFTMWIVRYCEQVAWRVCWNVSFEDTQNLTEQGSEPPNLTSTILCSEWGVRPDDLHRSCQHKFMILWLYTFLLGTCQWDIRNQINNKSFWTVPGFLAVQFTVVFFLSIYYNGDSDWK